MTIYIAKNEEKQGPYSFEDVVGMVRKGEYTLSNLAWREGMADWKPLHSFTDIVEAVMPPIPSIAQGHETTVSPPPIPKQVITDAQPPLKSPVVSEQIPTQPALIQNLPTNVKGADRTNNQQEQPKTDERIIMPAFLLSIFLGFLGFHAFYVGRVKQGVVFMALFILGIIFTNAGDAAAMFGVLCYLLLGVFWLSDILRIALGIYKDGQGRKITKWT